MYFQLWLSQWQGVIQVIPYGVLEFLVPFYPINTARFKDGPSKLIP